MRQFNIYKSMLEYLTDKDLSLNAKSLLSNNEYKVILKSQRIINKG